MFDPDFFIATLLVSPVVCFGVIVVHDVYRVYASIINAIDPAVVRRAAHWAYMEDQPTGVDP